MRFPQEFIEKVRDANNLVDLISQHTELKRAGDRLMGRCPFPDHSEKTGSFSVTESKQLYHCFGCKKSGNIFTFLETFNGMNFPEAIEFLAKRASIPIPAESLRGRDDKRDLRDSYLRVNKLTNEFFVEQMKRLPNDHPAIQYMVSRGLTAEIVQKFQIGVSIEPWEGLVTYLAQKKIPAPMLETLGLAKKKKSGSGYFDLFRERVMFPILSPSDEVIGFGGRAYTEQTPKYLNSPETPVFHKGKTLYGLHETGKFIRSLDRVIIVEGYMDAIAVYGAGHKNVVAILGTALTPDHVRLIKRYTNNVTLLLDGDKAGKTAAERSLPILLEGDLLVKGCFLPNGADPDDFVRKNGKEALTQELERAPELFSLVLGRWLEDYKGSSSEKVQLIAESYPVLKVMTNKQLRDLYVAEVAQRLDEEITWVTKGYVEASRKEKAAAGASAAPAKAKPQMPAHEGNPPAAIPMPEDDGKEELINTKGAPRDEAFVLSLALTSENLLGETQDMQIVSMLTHEGIKRSFEVAFEKYRQRPEAFDKLAASLASLMDDPSVVTCSLELTTNGMESGEESKLMASYLIAIQKRFYDRKLKALANQIRNQANSPRHQEMLEQFMNIQKARHALDKE
jgi:DNA primase